MQPSKYLQDRLWQSKETPFHLVRFVNTLLFLPSSYLPPRWACFPRRRSCHTFFLKRVLKTDFPLRLKDENLTTMTWSILRNYLEFRNSGKFYWDTQDRFVLLGRQTGGMRKGQWLGADRQSSDLEGQRTSRKIQNRGISLKFLMRKFYQWQLKLSSLRCITLGGWLLCPQAILMVDLQFGLVTADQNGESLGHI